MKQSANKLAVGTKCYLCDLIIEAGEACWEHLIPVKSRNGPDNSTNILPSHIKCNSKKGSRLPSECVGKAGFNINLFALEIEQQLLLTTNVYPRKTRSKNLNTNNYTIDEMKRIVVAHEEEKKEEKRIAEEIKPISKKEILMCADLSNITIDVMSINENDIRYEGPWPTGFYPRERIDLVLKILKGESKNIGDVPGENNCSYRNLAEAIVETGSNKEKLLICLMRETDHFHRRYPYYTKANKFMDALYKTLKTMDIDDNNKYHHRYINIIPWPGLSYDDAKNGHDMVNMCLENIKEFFALHVVLYVRRRVIA